ncbi:hypothetical protein [Paraburkholderia kirstenboschensis]|uniref:hypothetical protein n=1 Tax=Paraburkholderia kirstenboschensis TaxID=1245436 RepID=UPI000B2BD52A|nr:hypothetical protein [Paraburkholderia kirstenboschensis]
MGLIAVGLVLLWLVATVLYQYAAFQGILGPWDVFKLLPSWCFFAHPATRDSHLVLRDLLRDGTVTTWIPLSNFPSRRLLHVVWHPAKRPRKVLRDAAKIIKLTRSRSESKGVVQCSLPYLVILHFCMRQCPLDDHVVARQFAIVETSGRDARRIWITFISEFHRP